MGRVDFEPTTDGDSSFDEERGAPLEVASLGPNGMMSLLAAARRGSEQQASTAYAIGSAVQEAFNEASGPAWYDGQVVGNLDN